MKTSEIGQCSGCEQSHVRKCYASDSYDPATGKVKRLKVVLISLWLLVTAISLNHLFPLVPFLSQMPTLCLGILGWATALLSVLYFGKGHWRSVALVAMATFCLGFSIGTYLEPPADPFEHLRRVHEENCGKTAADIRRSNRGFWHYSMLTPILCMDTASVDSDKIFLRIHLANGLLWALACSVIYICGILLGLPRRWALFSVCVCFLFFGTNRFSYFRYYSLAPTFTSIMIYWLWGAVFFMRTSVRSMLKGVLTAMALVPVLWVNHHQEAVFLGFLLIIWVLTNLFFLRPYPRKQKNREQLIPRLRMYRFFLFVALFIVLWILPQSESFRSWLSSFFVNSAALENYKNLWITWHGWYIGPRFNGLRIADTLGNIGLLIGVLAIVYFWPGLTPASGQKKLKIYLLALLPFVGYFTPLFHFIWASNNKFSTYYRLCYASLFWFFFADLLYGLENKVDDLATKVLSRLQS